MNIENPKYRKNGGDKHAYRFSRDAALLVNVSKILELRYLKNHSRPIGDYCMTFHYLLTCFLIHYRGTYLIVDSSEVLVPVANL